MMEYETTDGDPWPWANWDGDDGAVDRHFGTDRPTGETEDEGAESGGVDAKPTTLTDGGTTTDCPECAAPTVGGQGLHWCADCDWTGSR